jgi:hypothetical protein
LEGVMKGLFGDRSQEMDQLFHDWGHVAFGVSVLAVLKEQYFANDRAKHCSGHVVFTVVLAKLGYCLLLLPSAVALQQSSEEDVQKRIDELRFAVLAEVGKQKVGRSSAQEALFLEDALLLEKTFRVNLVTAGPETQSEGLRLEYCLSYKVIDADRRKKTQLLICLFFTKNAKISFNLHFFLSMFTQNSLSILIQFFMFFFLFLLKLESFVYVRLSLR